VQNHFAEVLLSVVRQVLSVIMMLLGSILAANVSAGPCGGTALAVEPFPAILVAIFGLELIVCSYILVKSSRVESDFRVIIYLFLMLWTLSLLAPAVGLVRSGVPRLSEDLNDSFFSFLRGFAAAANLVLFYRWVGTKNMIKRFW